MTRVIGVVSGKGGVGKTTLVSNLGVGLVNEGYKVAVMDANLTGANLGLHFGLTFYDNSLNKVLKDEINLTQAIYNHDSKVDIIPASLSVEDVGVEPRNIHGEITESLWDKDFVLVDSATGLDRETLAAIDMSDELIIVTHPELPALSDALRTKNHCEKKGKRVIGIVLNKISKKDEIKSHNVSTFLDLPVIGIIHEDNRVRRAIESKNPVTLTHPRSLVSYQFKNIASRLVGKGATHKPTLMDKIINLIKR